MTPIPSDNWGNNLNKRLKIFVEIFLLLLVYKKKYSTLKLCCNKRAFKVCCEWWSRWSGRIISYPRKALNIFFIEFEFGTEIISLVFCDEILLSWSKASPGLFRCSNISPAIIILKLFFSRYEFFYITKVNIFDAMTFCNLYSFFIYI